MVISQTPLRISLVGGGTDFEDFYNDNGGAVISTAINKYVYVMVKERFDNKISANYFDVELVDNVYELRHDLIRETAILTGMPNGFEVHIMSDIPTSGTGLGSSSAVTVGLINAFYAYKGRTIDAERLAELACKVEIDILRSPIGKQDQYAVAFGGLNYITFDLKGVGVNKIELDKDVRRKLENNLMMFFTNITRKSSAILSEQKENINKDISTVSILNSLKIMADELYLFLTKNEIDKVGEYLNENWELKKHLSSNVTNVTIDKMYSTAISAGATGGKISGAGGGGFLLLFCDTSKQPELIKKLNGHREFYFQFEPHGSKIIFNYNTQELK